MFRVLFSHNERQMGNHLSISNFKHFKRGSILALHRFESWGTNNAPWEKRETKGVCSMKKIWETGGRAELFTVWGCIVLNYAL